MVKVISLENRGQNKIQTITDILANLTAIKVQNLLNDNNFTIEIISETFLDK